MTKKAQTPATEEPQASVLFTGSWDVAHKGSGGYDGQFTTLDEAAAFCRKMKFDEAAVTLADGRRAELQDVDGELMWVFDDGERPGLELNGSLRILCWM